MNNNFPAGFVWPAFCYMEMSSLNSVPLEIHVPLKFHATQEVYRAAFIQKVLSSVPMPISRTETRHTNV